MQLGHADLTPKPDSLPLGSRNLLGYLVAISEAQLCPSFHLILTTTQKVLFYFFQVSERYTLFYFVELLRVWLYFVPR